MSITRKNKGNFFILDITREKNQNQNPNPVNEVLAMLSGVNGTCDEYLLNFTSLKPSKFDKGDLEKLFTELPHSDRIQYYIALPNDMVSEATRIARHYDTTFDKYVMKPQYRIINKRTAIMMVNQ